MRFNVNIIEDSALKYSCQHQCYSTWKVIICSASRKWIRVLSTNCHVGVGSERFENTFRISLQSHSAEYLTVFESLQIQVAQYFNVQDIWEYLSWILCVRFGSPSGSLFKLWVCKPSAICRDVVSLLYCDSSAVLVFLLCCIIALKASLINTPPYIMWKILSQWVHREWCL